MHIMQIIVMHTIACLQYKIINEMHFTKNIDKIYTDIFIVSQETYMHICLNATWNNCSIASVPAYT